MTKRDTSKTYLTKLKKENKDKDNKQKEMQINLREPYAMKVARTVLRGGKF